MPLSTSLSTLLPSIRTTNLILFLGCATLLAIAFYLEFVVGMEPCPLCQTQRICVGLVGLIALIAFIHNPRHWGRRVYALIGLVFALGGAYFASRQLWLQSLPPDQVPACGPTNLSYMLDAWPFMDVLKVMLQGSGNCAEVDKVFGVTIPLWNLLAFGGMALVNLWQLARRR